MTHARNTLAALAVIGSSIAVASLVAWAASQGGGRIGAVPVMVLCAIIAFAIQWLAFVPAYLRQTEHFYDLVGSLTYVTVTGFAILSSPPHDQRSILLGVLICAWALRLGTFLFRRIQRAGSDERFDEIKTSASRFLVAWTLQGLWVFLTLCAALAAITTISPSSLGLFDAIGLAIWLLGFCIEVAADRQKSQFRRESPGRFIDTGLWAWSRHPNYFGEIVLWIGIAVMASSTLHGWQWATLVSPFFVALLLTRISGIPLLERRSDARWGDDQAYQSYKARTPTLIPRPPQPRELAA
jgi:steroid 5-alpha reductase family enzyme